MTEQTPDAKLQRTLFPQPHQLVIGKIKGSSYLGSLWIGFTMPIINLPMMLWHNVMLPAGGGLLFIVKTFVVAALAGLMGRAHGFIVDMPEMIITVTDGSEGAKK